MIDFAAARRMMVDGQVRTADGTDPRLLAAMLELPRERFFPADKASLAYLDLDASVSAPGQPVRRLLKPMVLAKLIQAAAITERNHQRLHQGGIMRNSNVAGNEEGLLSEPTARTIKR